MLISSRRWSSSILLTLRCGVWRAIYGGVRVGMVSVQWGAVYCLLRPGCSLGLGLLLLLLVVGCCRCCRVVVVSSAATFRATASRSARGRSRGGGIRKVTVAREPCEWTHRKSQENRQREKSVYSMVTLLPHQQSFENQNEPFQIRHKASALWCCHKCTNSGFKFIQKPSWKRKVTACFF